jgi:hypothetical protein
MHIDIEKLLREAGISILPGFDLEEDATAFPGGIDVTEMDKVKRYTALALEEAARGAATLGVPGISNVDDDAVAEWLRTLSRQITEGK